MTREEAIDHIKDVICENNTIKPNMVVFEQEKEALCMAIEALKAEPCEAVSRQAVNGLVDELARAISDERCCISRGRSTATIMQDILDLPPVTPKQRTGHWITQWNVVHQTEYYYCSECREEFSYDGETGIKMNDYDFCPHCGAKLEGVSE